MPKDFVHDIFLQLGILGKIAWTDPLTILQMKHGWLSSVPGSGTIYPRSSDPFYIVTYYMKWVSTSWTHISMTTFNSYFYNGGLIVSAGLAYYVI